MIYLRMKTLIYLLKMKVKKLSQRGPSEKGIEDSTLKMKWTLAKRSLKVKSQISVASKLEELKIKVKIPKINQKVNKLLKETVEA